MNDMKRNGDGYLDRTPYRAYLNIKKGRDKVAEDLVQTIYKVAHLAGFHVERITLVDNRTGAVYKK